MEEITINNEGVCPICGSNVLEWEDTEIDNNYVYYPFVCKKCGNGGYERYTLKYHSTTGILHNR